MGEQLRQMISSLKTLMLWWFRAEGERNLKQSSWSCFSGEGTEGPSRLHGTHEIGWGTQLKFSFPFCPILPPSSWECSKNCPQPQTLNRNLRFRVCFPGGNPSGGRGAGAWHHFAPCHWQEGSEASAPGSSWRPVQPGAVQSLPWGSWRGEWSVLKGERIWAAHPHSWT